MSKKSYDISSKFSSNQHDKIKDQFDYSPAQTEHYDYKDCIMGGIHSGYETKGRTMYDREERGGQKRMARMEQDKELK